MGTILARSPKQHHNAKKANPTSFSQEEGAHYTPSC